MAARTARAPCWAPVGTGTGVTGRAERRIERSAKAARARSQIRAARARAQIRTLQDRERIRHGTWLEARRTVGLLGGAYLWGEEGVAPW